MAKRPHILLTNDDGIDAPGLRVMRDALQEVGELTVCAPCAERSASGHAVSVNVALRFEERRENGALWGYALDGSPADCVKFALTALDIPKPDLLVSGINPGANTGNNILYSGTVAAAIEGAMYGVPSIALSVSRGDLVKRGETCYDAAADFAPRIARLVLEKGLPPRTILNVNVPNMPAEEIEDVAITKQGRAWFIDNFERGEGDGGEATYINVGAQWVSSSDQDADDADDQVVRHKRISITPLHYDLTRHDFRDALRAWNFTD